MTETTIKEIPTTRIIFDAGTQARVRTDIPVNIVVRKIGGEKFDRIIKYTLPPQKPPAVGNLTETDRSLCETCLNSGYDDGFELVCKSGWQPGDDCSHFEGVTESSEPADDVPF